MSLLRLRLFQSGFVLRGNLGLGFGCKALPLGRGGRIGRRRGVGYGASSEETETPSADTTLSSSCLDASSSALLNMACVAKMMTSESALSTTAATAMPLPTFFAFHDARQADDGENQAEQREKEREVVDDWQKRGQQGDDAEHQAGTAMPERDGTSADG